ncbi:hypothetical protein [Paenibacillus marinisediminis]
MNKPHNPNGAYRDLTKIPGFDMALARQEAARIAQSSAASRSQQHTHSRPHQAHRSSSSISYGDISSANLTAIPTMPQSGGSALSPYTAPAPIGESAALVPYDPPQEAAASAEAKPKKSRFSLNEIKGAFERIGGVEGIIASMGQAQKVITSVTQMAPMAKLLVGSIFTKKGSSDDEDDESKPRRPRRKRKRRRSSHTIAGGGRRKPSRSASPWSRPTRRPLASRR